MNTKTLPLQFDNIVTQKIDAGWLAAKNIDLDVLRLDLIHPVISGNKWFKLQYYLQEAVLLAKPAIATFGGAYSNHLLATAFACKVHGLQSVGFIRGEKPQAYSATLKEAEGYGMQLIFISREQYKLKDKVAEEFQHFNWYWIDEGGYGTTGARGAQDILNYTNKNDYTHLAAAVGTGTMLAGLVMASKENQHVIGISCMKGNHSIENATRHLITPGSTKARYTIIHDYHFGGYAKHTKDLLSFIQESFDRHHLPLDIVYTAKLFYGLRDLIEKSFFPLGSKLLMIHSGGLQGNRSLPGNALSFL